MTTMMKNLLPILLAGASSADSSSLRRNLRAGGGGGNADDSAAIATSQHDDIPRRPSRRRLATGPFVESSCNAAVDNELCAGIDSFLSANGIDPLSEEVAIPCGACVSFDVADGSLYEFSHGLNVVGKLHIPEDADFTLNAKFVLVQGILRMDPPTSDLTIPRQDGAVVRIVLNGTDDVKFEPDGATDNVGACPAGGCGVGSKPFAVAGGRLDINAIADSCPTWTKLQSLSGDLKRIGLADPAAASCWAAGAELLFTPDGYDSSEAQVATIESVNLLDQTITLTAPLTKKLSSIDDGWGEMYAVEVALVTRRVVFEPDDDTGAMGGHTIVMHTPGVVQNIKGVEFRKFGQQGLLGRYPVHFHMNDYVTGSVVSKNLVRESNQRCYVAHGTHDITFSDNVAYDTFGHCFMIEDGGEWDNSFVRNLGAKTKNVPQGGLIPDQPESDDEAATFWITNTKNDFIDNVAAGSEEFGFWLDVKLRGPSASLQINDDLNAMRQSFDGTFVGNVAHSNDWHGIALYPGNYRPDALAVLGEMFSYKNSGFGLRVGGSFNLHLGGGVLADNTNGGYESSGALPGYTNILEDFSIVGVSSHLGDLITEGRIPASSRPCDIVGATYPPGKSWRGSSFDQFSTELRNVAFEGFADSQGCDTRTIVPSTIAKTNGVPFAVDELVQDGVSFGPNTSKPYSVCSAVTAGFEGFALEDSSGGGFLVQENYPALTAFLDPNTCHPAESGTCLSSCPNTCFRLLKVKIAGSEIHDSKQLIVTETTSGSTALVPKRVFTNKHKHSWSDVVPLYLPGGTGRSYSVSFVDADGTTAAWPGYASLALGSAPSCTDHVEEVDINIEYPAPDDRCLNPVYNGDMERGDFHGWQDAGYAGMATVTGGAAGTSFSLRTTKGNRMASQGLWNHVDVSCLRGWVGKNIRLSGYLDTLDPSTMLSSSSSVSIMLRIEDSSGTYDLVSAAVPTDGVVGSWAFFETTVVLPPSVVDATKAILIIDGAANNHIVIDEWRLDADPILMPCRKPGVSCSESPNTCMVDSCTEVEVDNQGYTRVHLEVAAGANPSCAQHGSGDWTGRLRCKMHSTGFGKTTPWLNGDDLAMGDVDVGFVNTVTGEVLNVKFVRHWTWKSNSVWLFFSVYSPTLAEGRDLVNTMFDNSGGTEPLSIEVHAIPK